MNARAHAGHSMTRKRPAPPRAMIVALTAILAALLAPLAVSAQDDWAAPRTVFIPESGQTIDGYFLDVWREWGGVNAFGYPITPELTENDRIVQYYEYARFEYVPDDPNGNVVHFGQIGKELRPVTLFRTKPGIFGGGDSRNAAAELAREVRAWAPLASTSAQQPNTATWRYVPETQHSVQNGFKDFWESTGEAAYLGNPLTEEFEGDGVTYQVFERGKLSWTADQGVAMMPIGSILAKRYGHQIEPLTTSEFPIYSEELFIPPPAPQPASIPGGEHWISINLSSQYLVAWEGDVPVMESYVSTGRPGFDTPAGSYFISVKLESENMEGVLGGEYYNVPDVPYVMYFTDLGHALHGTYWHDAFGSVMSHGCVNLPMWFAEWLYYWAESGTRIEISY